jgi:glycosyltransferase involved in cell wall biosynthesis
MPKISIIVPIYNVEKYLRKCLDSILSQTFSDFELILVNDYSLDNSAAICLEYANKDKRIKLVNKQKNEGLPQARKTGFENSIGEFIINIDSDDWIEPNMLEKLYQKAISDNCDIVICHYYSEKDGVGNVIQKDFSSFDKTKIIKNIISYIASPHVWNKLIKKELYQLAEFPKLSNSEDYVITIQNIYNSNKIGYVNLPLYHYRYNAQSLSNDNERKITARIQENKNWGKVINFLKEKYGSLEIFEPELSNRVNGFKLVYISDKDLRKNKELFNLYPESKFKKFLLRFCAKQTVKALIPPKLRASLKYGYARIKAIRPKRQTLNLISTLKPLELPKNPQYIVSLTSYGKRLKDTAPYAIISLFNQNLRPDRIILWVARNDSEKIPPIMEKLQEKGLDIIFCEDVKSYKKLIPALEIFPDDYIITADDDLYYPQNWFEQIMTEHKKNPKKIICHRVHGIKGIENKNLLPYNEWDFCQNPNFAKRIFPTGGAGALYPPKCLHKDITNKELFMKLAPHADDVWFWAMAVINKEYFGEESPYIVIENGYSLDLQEIEPKQTRKGNALVNYNVSQNGNDKQLKAVIEHYSQILEYLKKIEPFDSGKY